MDSDVQLALSDRNFLMNHNRHVKLSIQFEPIREIKLTVRPVGDDYISAEYYYIQNLITGQATRIEWTRP